MRGGAFIGFAAVTVLGVVGLALATRKAKASAPTGTRGRAEIIVTYRTEADAQRGAQTLLRELQAIPDQPPGFDVTSQAIRTMRQVAIFVDGVFAPSAPTGTPLSAEDSILAMGNAAALQSYIKRDPTVISVSVRKVF